MGTVAMAGNVITFSALLFINIPGNALATAATILIGQRLGQNRSQTAQIEMQLLFWLASIALIVLALVCLPFASAIAHLYTDDQ
ncbi:MATE family efflux transporter, partial [Streptomyces sp. P17]